jgi:predicted Zn-dependent protease with MMP-like domain
MSYAILIVWWRVYGTKGPGAWVFPAAVRVGITVVFVGSRLIASGVRTEQRQRHPQPRPAPNVQKARKATLSVEELRAAETYDAEWHEREHEREHDVARHHDALTHLEPDAHFQRLVDEALDELPADIRARMSNIAVVVEDEPPRGERLLGLYRGVPLTRRTSRYGGVLPDKITIYRGPLERHYGSDPTELRGQVRRTVRHEIAHHFGISDQRLIDIDRY